jgi:hypothetical protein
MYCIRSVGVKQVYVNVDEMSAQGCSGGVCEITF